VHRLPAWGPNPVAALLFIVSALWKIWRLNPDLLHAFELLSPTTTAIIAKKLLRKPLLVKVLRGGTLGDLYKVQRGRFGKWRTRWIVNAVDVYAVISREIDMELEAVGVPAGKRLFIPNGVDLARYRPAGAQQKTNLRKHLELPDGLMVLFAGRLEPEKRLDQLLDVWKRIRVRCTNSALVLAGSGSEEKRLREQAGAGVYFPGSIPDVLPYLQSADVFVLPSATEGLSNSLLEAMGSGLPAIATRVGGAIDLIEHGANGWLIDPDRPEQLEDALLTLLGDAALRERLGNAARKKMEQDYSLVSAAERLASLYKTLTKESR
jgi:glycosyltransferase involved in cell wall biosynthesis